MDSYNREPVPLNDNQLPVPFRKISSQRQNKKLGITKVFRIVGTRIRPGRERLGLMRAWSFGWEPTVPQSFRL